MIESIREIIFLIKVRAVGSVYFVGMDFSPSTIDGNLLEYRRYGIFNLQKKRFLKYGNPKVVIPTKEESSQS